MKISDSSIARFQKILFSWFKKNRRDFPWRMEGLSSYQLIISEILLQRTKAETASNFYNKFIVEFPDWQALANSTQENLAAFLRPIGLYNQRATRLIELAKHMAALNTEIPLERVKIDEIPFMGQYIANAVELLVHGQPKPLLDVNMARVLERYFGSRVKADIRYDPYLQDLAHRVVMHKNSKEISWAILDFGAIICQSRTPKCSICSLLVSCKFFNDCINPYI